MKIQKINTYYKNKKYPIILGISSIDHNSLFKERKEFLHHSELEFFDQIKYEHKRKNFLQSRHLAKSILSKYLKEANLSKIAIFHGVFNQPLIDYPTNKIPTISISHTQTLAACIVSPSIFPIGIDIEKITENSKENITSQTTLHEKRNLKYKEDDNIFYTRIWTVKEALSKVLKTGIMSPFKIFEIKDIIYTKNYTISKFSNFNQYHAISYHYEQNILSYIIPSNSNLLDFDKILIPVR